MPKIINSANDSQERYVNKKSQLTQRGCTCEAPVRMKSKLTTKFHLHSTVDDA